MRMPESSTMSPPTTNGTARHDGFEETLRWREDIRSYAYRLTGSGADADDLTQTTYLNALRGWHTFQRGTEARRWLFGICRNAFLTTRRRGARIVPTEGAVLESLLAADSARADQTMDEAERRDLGEAIIAEVAKLSTAHRKVFVMVDVAGERYEDAADKLGLPIGTVRSRLYRGRRLLQQGLRTRAEDAGLCSATEGAAAR